MRPPGIGPWLASAPMNRVRREGAGFHKERTAWGQLAAACSRRLPLPLVMLAGDAWFAREETLYRALHGRSVERRGPHALWLPALPGERLDRLAARRGWPAIRPAVDAAFASLAALHGLDEPVSMGSIHASTHSGATALRPLTHSDATARNALLDEATGAVAFFDFETTHPLSWSTDDRRAADLLALGGSLAAALGPAAFGELAGRVRQAHGGRLLASVRRLADAPDAVALAQAPLPSAHRARWRDALRSF